MVFLHRILENFLAETVQTRPLVYLNGMRQSGKSTLVQHMSVNKKLNYVSFDIPAVLSFAKTDPAGFIHHLPSDRLNVIDEVQLAPELFRYFKMAIDEKRMASVNKALYVLTGSANLYALPRLADALVGRMSTLTLYPFSASEIRGTNVNFLEKLWNADPVPGKYSGIKLIDTILNSTFPELAMNRKLNRILWFNDYITTILQRDVRTLADIKNPENIYQLLVLFSQRAGGIINNTNLMKETGLDAKTYEKYKAICSSTFLIFELPSWSKPNQLNKKFIKQKKLYFTDTSLLCHIMQRDLNEIYRNDLTVMGHIFENFIASEIMKAASTLDSVSVSHFNPVQYQGREVDFIVENRKGEAIGIEVKLSGTIDGNDWMSMKVLQEVLGKKFKKGIIIYTGNTVLQVSRKIWAVPVNYLWEKEFRTSP